MKKRGIGIGCMYYGIGYGFSRQDISSATVEICEDGSVIVRSGEVDYGQGSDTIFMQIVAEELGINYDEIRLIAADTESTPNSGPTSGSRLTYVVGNAMLKGARAVKETMEPVAEDILGETDLEFRNEKVYSVSHPEKSITFKKLAKECHARGLQIVETAWHDITTKDVDKETGQGDAYDTYAWGSQIAEVEVDTETGKVEVLRIVAAHDVGKAINPSNVVAQIEGAVATGVGLAVGEEIVQEGGYLKTMGLAHYNMATSLDMPEIESHIIEVPAPGGPYGAKGVGEPALIPTAPAIINAVYDALGLKLTKFPANLENVYQMMQGKKTGKDLDPGPWPEAS